VNRIRTTAPFVLFRGHSTRLSLAQHFENPVDSLGCFAVRMRRDALGFDLLME
jgi:hypothetical protein